MHQRLLEARPTAVRIDPERTAVVVVDMQNDFASDGGMFQRAGIDLTEIRAIVPNIAAVIDAARSAHVLVCYLRMGSQQTCPTPAVPPRRHGSSIDRSMSGRR